MEWQTVLQDAGTIASVSTAIFFVIDFIKKLYYKLPWGWIQKTPGEVWFALSILFGVGVAIIVYWDNFFGTGATLSDGLSATTYGLVSGAGSKFMNSIFGTAGAKLKAYKEEAKEKIESKPETVMEVSTPEIEEATPKPEKIPEDSITMIPNKVEVPLIELVKKMKTDADYVIISDKIYRIEKENKND